MYIVALQDQLPDFLFMIDQETPLQIGRTINQTTPQTAFLLETFRFLNTLDGCFYYHSIIYH